MRIERLLLFIFLILAGEDKTLEQLKAIFGNVPTHLKNAMSILDNVLNSNNNKQNAK